MTTDYCMLIFKVISQRTGHAQLISNDIIIIHLLGLGRLRIGRILTVIQAYGVIAFNTFETVGILNWSTNTTH